MASTDEMRTAPRLRRRASHALEPRYQRGRHQAAAM